MNGWVSLVLIAALVALILWRAGVSRHVLAIAAPVIGLGILGYALQGRAMLPGSPAQADAATVAIDPSIVDLRGALLGRFSGDGAYLIASDALMRRGSRDSGVQVVLMGLNHYPRSLTLWVGLGTALAQHDGMVSPAARFAFNHATQVAPDHPAPPFFEGLAYVEAGDFRAAQPYWARALALSPPAISYRREIAVRLYALNIALAQRGY